MKFTNNLLAGLNAWSKKFRMEAEYKARQAEIKCQFDEEFEKRKVEALRKGSLK